VSIGLEGRRVAPRLDLPPPYRLVSLREGGDAFAHACCIAATAGAGTLVHVGRFDVAEIAVVLEPSETLASARRIIYALLPALIDAVAIDAPPKCRIDIVWPGAIRVEKGLVGAVRLAWAVGAVDDVVPDWLVVGVMLQLVAADEREPGSGPSALDQAGFDDLEADEVVARCARHLMAALDAWQHETLATVAARYLKLLMHEEDGVPELDDNGDLVIARANGRQRDHRSLAAALSRPAWLDPVTGGEAGGLGQ
jgi:Biotin/lipoate A/B protein ligase family